MHLRRFVSEEEHGATMAVTSGLRRNSHSGERCYGASAAWPPVIHGIWRDGFPQYFPVAIVLAACGGLSYTYVSVRFSERGVCDLRVDTDH